MIGDFVAHDLHDIVAIRDKAQRKSCREHSKLPERNGCFGPRSFTSVPSTVDDGPGSNSITNIISTVCKGCGASSDNLNERVCVLNFVRVFLGMAVDTLHAFSFGGTMNSSLGSVNVVVDTIKSTDHDHSGNSFDGNDHVLSLVYFATFNLVVVKVAHSPSKKATFSPDFGVEAVLALLDKLFVGKLVMFLDNSALLKPGSGARVRVTVGVRNRDVVIFLYNSVIGNDDSFGVVLSRTFE